MRRRRRREKRFRNGRQSLKTRILRWKSRLCRGLIRRRNSAKRLRKANAIHAPCRKIPLPAKAPRKRLTANMRRFETSADGLSIWNKQTQSKLRRRRYSGKSERKRFRRTSGNIQIIAMSKAAKKRSRKTRPARLRTNPKMRDCEP